MVMANFLLFFVGKAIDGITNGFIEYIVGSNLTCAAKARNGFQNETRSR